MVRTNRCKGIKQRGARCSAPHLRDGNFCFWHDPAHETEAREARRLGGLRRKREGTIRGAYDFDGIASVQELQRILEIAVTDAIGLDNSVPRVRALIAVALAGAKLLEIGELEERLAAVEAALMPSLKSNTKR